MSYEATRSGISLGSVIAVVASWSRNKSIPWAILHGFLGWLYVVYYVLTDPISVRNISITVASVIVAVSLIIAFLTLFR